MSNVSNKICKLLEEFDDICKKYSLRYCLEGQIVRDFFYIGKLSKYIYNIDVSMEPSDIKKLMYVLQDEIPHNRCLKIPVVSVKNLNFLIRYIATDTICIDLNSNKEIVNKCLGITIHARVNKYDNMNEGKANKLVIAWAGKLNGRKVFIRNIIPCTQVKLIKTLFGEYNAGKKIFEKWIVYMESHIDCKSYFLELEKNNMTINDYLCAVKKKFNTKNNYNDKNEFNILDQLSNVIPSYNINDKNIPVFCYDKIGYIELNGRKFPVSYYLEAYLWFDNRYNKDYKYVENKRAGGILVSDLFTCEEFYKKHEKEFKINRKLLKFEQIEKQKRRFIRKPIRKMFKIFGEIFYRTNDNKE